MHDRASYNRNCTQYQRNDWFHRCLLIVLEYVASGKDILGRARFVCPDRSRAIRIVRWPRKVEFRAPLVRIALSTQFSEVMHLCLA
jgi:hypothetical protein